MKKHKFVAYACSAKHCGNYNRCFKNHCQALKGVVPANYLDCWAFMTKDRAKKLDRQFADERERRKNHAK